MKTKLKRGLAVLVMLTGILTSGPINAFAYTNEDAQDIVITETMVDADAATIENAYSVEDVSSTGEGATETEAGDERAETESGEERAETEPTSFSVAGNGQLVDDMSDDGTKEFLTVQTKNGNTFFLILDRSGSTENTYMLSMIDENDLADFLEEKEPEQEPEPEPSVVLVTEPEPALAIEEPEPEPEKSGMNVGALLAVAVFLAGGAGAYYYLKVLKPKKEEEEAEDEDLEFYDGGAYINEDGEDHPDEEEE